MHIVYSESFFPMQAIFPKDLTPLRGTRLIAQSPQTIQNSASRNCLEQIQQSVFYLTNHCLFTITLVSQEANCDASHQQQLETCRTSLISGMSEELWSMNLQTVLYSGTSSKDELYRYSHLIHGGTQLFYV